MEYREYRVEGVGVSDEGVITGLVTPFRTETTIGDPRKGGFREEVGDGCFTKTLTEGDPLWLWQHNMAMPLARKSAGNLDLREGQYEGQDGLVLRSTPVDTTYARDMRALIAAKVVKGMSFGFEVVKDEWFDDEGKRATRFDGTRRVLREVKLVEVSAVTNPAYKSTVIHARDDVGVLLEERASNVNTADRKALASKGHALPDGSYPIPDKAHLHAAAVLAASKHGDYQAAKALIRRRAKDLGVDVNTLPGFGGEQKSADELLDMAAQLLTAYNELPDEAREELPEATRAAIEALRPEERSQEPEASTPEDDDDDFALWVSSREADYRSRELDSSEA